MSRDLLRDLRRRKGWTQQIAAQKLGVSIDSIRSWEGGRRPIRPMVFLVIQQLLHQTKGDAR